MDRICPASESTFSRVLRTNCQSARREVWCWDMTYMPANVLGRWFYLCLILDLYSCKILCLEVHASNDSDHDAHLVRRTAVAVRIAALESQSVLHGDDDATLKPHDGASNAQLVLFQAVILASSSERRQRLLGEPVTHAEVPPGVPTKASNDSPTPAPGKQD